MSQLPPRIRKMAWFLLIPSLAFPSLTSAQVTPPPLLDDNQSLEMKLGQFHEGLGTYEDARYYYEAAVGEAALELAEQAWQSPNPAVRRPDR